MRGMITGLLGLHVWICDICAFSFYRTHYRKILARSVENAVDLRLLIIIMTQINLVPFFVFHRIPPRSACASFVIILTAHYSLPIIRCCQYCRHRVTWMVSSYLYQWLSNAKRRSGRKTMTLWFPNKHTRQRHRLAKFGGNIFWERVLTTFRQNCCSICLIYYITRIFVVYTVSQ